MTPTALIDLVAAHGLKYQGTMCCLPEVGRVSIQAFTEAGARIELIALQITGDVWQAQVWVFARPLEAFGRVLDRWKVIHGWHQYRAPDQRMVKGSLVDVLNGCAAWANIHAINHV